MTGRKYERYVIASNINTICTNSYLSSTLPLHVTIGIYPQSLVSLVSKEQTVKDLSSTSPYESLIEAGASAKQPQLPHQLSLLLKPVDTLQN